MEEKIRYHRKTLRKLETGSQFAVSFQKYKTEL